MNKPDARKLPQVVQEALRQQVIRALLAETPEQVYEQVAYAA